MSGDEVGRIDRAEGMVQYAWTLLQSFIPDPDTSTPGTSDDGHINGPESSCDVSV